MAILLLLCFFFFYKLFDLASNWTSSLDPSNLHGSIVPLLHSKFLHSDWHFRCVFWAVAQFKWQVLALCLGLPGPVKPGRYISLDRGVTMGLIKDHNAFKSTAGLNFVSDWFMILVMLMYPITCLLVWDHSKMWGRLLLHVLLFFA